MRILITGAFGNLGLLCIAEALRQGHAVSCFDLDNRRNQRAARKLGSKVSVFWGDILDPEAVAKAVEGQEAVIHTAAMLPPASEKFPERGHTVNVDGTKLLIQLLEKQPNPPVIVYTSSVVVFPPEVAQSEIVGPNSTIRGTDVYSTSKVECEQLLQASSLPWAILRIAVAIDEKLQKVEPIIMRLMFEIRADNRIEVVHSEDVALALVNATHTTAAHRKILLIGGGKSCQLHHGALNQLFFNALQVRNFPDEAFGTSPYYTAWMDTEESQAILKFQRHSPEEIAAAMAHKFRMIAPLLRLVSPLVKRHLLSHSGPYQGHPARPTLQDFEGEF